MYREKSHTAQKEAHEKIAYKHFKEGDLALFLPTRNQAAGAWAAFNVGAPHYFLREQDSHKLRARDWLLARIHKIEDRVVDLSKSMTGQRSNAEDRGSIGEDSFEDDNPFDLSDGLRWYLIDASEEKPGAPSTPGLGKSTVATAPIDATGSIRKTKKSSSGGVDGVSKTLSRSLDSRRSSSNSKKAVPAASSSTTATPTPTKAPTSLSDINAKPSSAAADAHNPSSTSTMAPPESTDRISTDPSSAPDAEVPIDTLLGP
jgi:autophagy-related protein 11